MEEMIMKTKMLSKVVANAVRVIGKTPFLLPRTNWPMTERLTSIHARAAAKKKPEVKAFKLWDSSCLESMSKPATTRSEIGAGSAATAATSFGSSTTVGLVSTMAAMVQNIL